MKRFTVVIEGIAPLLQARHVTPHEEKDILKRSSGKKAKAKDLTDKEQFELHAYRTKSKKFYQPSDMVEAAMTKAATNFKMEGKKSYKDVINGGIIVDPEQLVHKSQKAVLDARWGRNRNTGGAVWVVRPRFDKWQLQFTINLLQDERVPAEILKDILTYAGLYVGIGAWRPKFGRFKVVKFQETK
jgi:hypothetical protein